MKVESIRIFAFLCPSPWFSECTRIIFYGVHGKRGFNHCAVYVAEEIRRPSVMIV